jgi:hypothetical protein
MSKIQDTIQSVYFKYWILDFGLKDYSVFKLFTGLAIAALIAW